MNHRNLASSALGSLFTCFFTSFFTCFLVGLSVVASEADIPIPITNFHKVDENIYRGARPSGSASYQFLKQIGVKTIINLEGDATQELFPGRGKGKTSATITTEKHQAALANLNFIHMPLRELPAGSREFRERVEKVLQIMSEPSNQPVFIHCLHGADRTGVIVALYRVKYMNWKASEAWHEMNVTGHNFGHYLFTSDLDELFVNLTAQWARSN
jgi:protein tyrosine/serine phosphatase